MLCHACGESRVWRAPRKKKRIYGQMVTMPNLDLMARVRASQSSCPFLFQLFFVVVTQTPQATDSTRAVQGACYNQPATTLYTPAACQQSRKQHHTRAVVCPRCTTAVFKRLPHLEKTCIMPWDVLEKKRADITLTYPISGVARAASMLHTLLFVQPTANAKTCLPTNNCCEDRKRLLIYFRLWRIEESD